MSEIGLTAASVLHSATHGRERRLERNIEKIDLQRARRYGMKEAARHGRVKYTYGGICFIYDPETKSEVTSYQSSDVSMESSGTKVSKPIILSRKDEYDDISILTNREMHKTTFKKKSWTSHSVLIVDMSGSMRRDDVNGARCRSDGVWMALARDYVKKPLEMKTRSKTDVVSVIVMKDEAYVVMKYEPTDWVLYNKLIDMREWNELKPSGPGNYMPSLEKAELLLTRNLNSKCALSLLFFSDGKPSDRGDFAGKMGNVVSKFGRRLSIACIGMAEVGEDFSTLNKMVTEAQAFGAVASFGKPSLDADSLSNLITSLASSLTTSLAEMTNIETGALRKIRMDITREKVDTPDDLFLTSDWIVFETFSCKQFVANIWSWDYKLNNFVRIVDHRCVHCWKMTTVFDKKAENGQDLLCPDCETVSFCLSCYQTAVRRGGKSLHRNCSISLQEKRLGNIVCKEVPSFDVAVKQPIFGEGAERIVRKFRYLENGKFIGPVMVAKESRFRSNDGTNKQQLDYHREFMHTQAISAEYAKKFNEVLDEIPSHFPSEYAHHVRQKTSKFPRIEFLQPMVVEVIDHSKENPSYNILIEPMLEGTYEKFNDNKGMVRGQAQSVRDKDLVSKEHIVDDVTNVSNELEKSFHNQAISSNLEGLADSGLGAIQEGSEDEEDESDDLIEIEQSIPMEGSYILSNIKKEHIPQSFSHFTYQKSKTCLMVVDLQGVLCEKSDGTILYQFTDPVIHKQRLKNKRRFRHWSFGRTDRGQKGMNAFFHTHQCNELCRLIGLEQQR